MPTRELKRNTSGAGIGSQPQLGKTPSGAGIGLSRNPSHTRLAPLPTRSPSSSSSSSSSSPSVERTTSSPSINRFVAQPQVTNAPRYNADGYRMFGRDEALKFAGKENKNIIEQLSKPMITAITNYTSGNYTHINGFLRKGDNYIKDLHKGTGGPGTAEDERKKEAMREETRKMVEDTVSILDEAMKLSKLSENILTYKGLSNFERLPAPVKGYLEGLVTAINEGNDKGKQNAIKRLRGQTVLLKGFESTSPYKGVTDAFSSGAGSAVLTISAPEGTRGMFVNQWSKAPQEVEFLLDRGQKLVIDSVEVPSGKSIQITAHIELTDLNDPEVLAAKQESNPGFTPEPN